MVVVVVVAVAAVVVLAAVNMVVRGKERNSSPQHSIASGIPHAFTLRFTLKLLFSILVTVNTPLWVCVINLSLCLSLVFQLVMSTLAGHSRLRPIFTFFGALLSHFEPTLMIWQPLSSSSSSSSSSSGSSSK